MIRIVPALSEHVAFLDPHSCNEVSLILGVIGVGVFHSLKVWYFDFAFVPVLLNVDFESFANITDLQSGFGFVIKNCDLSPTKIGQTFFLHRSWWSVGIELGKVLLSHQSTREIVGRFASKFDPLLITRFAFQGTSELQSATWIFLGLFGSSSRPLFDNSRLSHRPFSHLVSVLEPPRYFRKLVSRTFAPQHSVSRFCLFEVFGLLQVCSENFRKDMNMHCYMAIPYLQINFAWYIGRRIGEASNPGPNSSSMKAGYFECAFVNPTSLNGKISNICCLDKHLWLFAETSATRMIQMQEAAEARKNGFRAIFSPPVLPQRNGLDEDTLRGQATGTATYSKIPVRLSRTIEQSEWYPSGRILQIFLELGSIEIQVFIIYGFQLNHPQSRARTDQLVQHAIDLAGLTNHPTIFAGDFNHSLDSLRSCDILWQQGFRSAAAIHLEQTGDFLPPTYKNQSSNDVAIFSPELVPFISDVQVNSQELFAGHHPLCFRVNLPVCQLTKQKWKLPQSWLGLSPDPLLINDAYIPMRSEDGTWDATVLNAPQTVLQLWSSKIEASVHAALKQQHAKDPVEYPYNGLPKSFRGRCKPRKLVQMPLPKATKTAWKGHYTPSTDSGSIFIRQRTKQIRRIQSLKRRIFSFRSEQIDQLWEEWQAILDSTGFKGGFVNWISAFDQFHGFYPFAFPTVELLYDMEQILIYDTDCQVAEDLRIKRAKVTMQETFDLKHQHKKASFQKIREPSPGLLQQVEIINHIPVEHMQNDGWGLASLLLEDNHYVDATLPAKLNGHRIDIIDLQKNRCEIMIHDVEVTLEPPFVLTQQTTTVSPQKVANTLTEYWNQFWMKSPLETDSWENFQNLLDKLPQHDTIGFDILDDEAWIQAIKSLKSGTARGVDAWAPDELKQLPTKPLIDLKHAFHLLEPIGMPLEMMQARVIPLNKLEGVFSVKNTRPITVIALLYRLWSKIASTVVLERFSRIFPPSITGFLPTRKAQTFLYNLQFQIEVALKTNCGKAWGGLTLDLVKCFNTLQHLPCEQILAKLGVSPKIFGVLA